jgi:hypothetical protein
LQDGHRLDDEHLALDAPVAVFDAPAKWVVSIDNGDDAPIILRSVGLEMLRRQLCFDSMPGARYRLYYGDPSLTSPHYDYATLFVPRANAARVSAGPQQQNPDYRSRPDTRPFTERHPALLWLALVLVIAVLAGIALRPLLRKPTA